MIKTWILGVSAVAMTALPVAASAAPAAQSLSVASSVRTGTATTKSSKLAGLQDSTIVPLIIGAGVIAGVAYLIIDHEDDNDSDSN
ncbi:MULTISPECIES: hypothetical protein [Sphingomonas]|uniref:hypothetical protein n=1 Tax=Sphingomonas TaxID=13687 RepID=UPI0020BE7E48|nr:hypothetical protein [Sphingomonas faeni]